MAKDTTTEVINITDTDEEHHSSPNISEECHNSPERVLNNFNSVVLA